MDSDSNESGRTIRGVNISYRLLSAIQEQDRPSLPDIASAVDHSKSTVYSHLTTLEENEMVVKKEGNYRLGLRFIEFAESVRDEIGNFDIIEEELDTTANQTGEVLQFGLVEHGQVKYLYKSRGNRAVVTASRPGAAAPVHSTGLGKAILSALPEERVHEILDSRGMSQRTPDTITDRDELLETLERTRERGYALDNEENLAGLRCVAAPVEGDGDVFGAVSLTGPSRRFSREQLVAEYADVVRETANVIEINTKYS